MPDLRETPQYLTKCLETKEQEIRATHDFCSKRGDLTTAEYHRGRLEMLQLVLGMLHWQTTRGWEKGASDARIS
jgi:hypothetical protein